MAGLQVFDAHGEGAFQRGIGFLCVQHVVGPHAQIGLNRFLGRIDCGDWGKCSSRFGCGTSHQRQ